MSLRGKRPKVDFNTQKSIFLKHKNALFPTLPKRTDPIYDTLFCDLNKEMTKDSIYLSIKKNYLIIFGVDDFEVDAEEELSEVVISESESSQSSISYKASSEDDYENTFSIFIDSYQWREIEPVTYHYTRRDVTMPHVTYKPTRKLQKERWTALVREEIWKRHKNQCSWVFKSNYVRPNGDVICKGNCKSCNANIIIRHNATCLSTENYIEMKCSLLNFNPNISHDKDVKVRLTKYKKQQLAKMLAKNKPSTVRNLLADKYMKPGEMEPPIVPSLNTLQQIRHQTKQANFLHPSPILSLWCMVFTPPYDEVIRKICLHPFYLLYWTNEQNIFYEVYSKTNKYIKVSIDATGSILKKNYLPAANIYTENANKQKKHIFFYVMMGFRTEGSSVPLCQMLSEVNTQNNIRNFLKKWLKGKCVPNECISDDSAAILGAVITVFNGLDSTNIYLQQCFQLLEENSYVRPKCYVRLDKSHFVKSLCKQSCFDHVDKRVKSFYIKCVLLLRRTECYNQLKSILECIITVACNRYIGLTENKQISRCSNSLMKLQTMISNLETDVNQPSLTEDEHENHMEEEVPDDLHDNLLIRFCEIIERRETVYNESIKQGFDNENLYYFPTFLNYLKRILKKVPMWGEVMTKYFDLATANPSSSNVENYFKDIKTVLLNVHHERLRIDEFLQKHIPHVSGALKMAVSDALQHESLPLQRKTINVSLPPKKTTITLETDDCKSFDKESYFLDSPSTTENWKGQMNPKAKKPKLVHILKNGSITYSYVPNVEIFNTCAFDSVFQSMAIAYVDRPKIKKYISINKDNEICQFITQIAKKEDKTILYKKRTYLLVKLFGKDVNTDGNILVDCVTTTADIINMLYPTFYSTMRRKICTNRLCLSDKKNFTKCPYMPINIDIIQQEGIAALNKSINRLITKDKGTCSDCSATVKFDYYPTTNLFIETCGISSIDINDVPISIRIGKQKYIVLAVIQYVPGGVGHFRCWCYRKATKNWQCYDDLQDLTALPSTKILPHNIIYTT